LKKGGKIFFTPKIKSYLFIRPSLSKLYKQHFQYGYFKPLVAKKIGFVLTWRQLIPAIFVGSLITSLLLSIVFKPFGWLFILIFSLYLIANLSFSSQISIKKGTKYLPVLPIVFATLHFSYGFGFLKGIWDFIILKKHKKRKIEDVEITR
jgi:hypothetical protein